MWARARIYFSDRLGEMGQHTTDMREESTNNKDMLILILIAMQHTKKEITEKSERVSNLNPESTAKE